ncbi:hypothetical protein ACMGDK_11450 [Chryseobacterium sp. DT-3]|uniref:hypothetical protein n=1 Tax=Chryseobacterium sp. DT-3 TaxID=3396164 RepID=UPI003F194983
MGYINKFPDELVPNSVKDSYEFGQEYARAIWSSEENNWLHNLKKFEENQLYADAKHPIDHCKSSIKRKFVNESFLSIDWDSRVTILSDHLPKIWNGIDMSEFVPSVYAIDPTAKAKKKQRKDDKLKLFLAKDFLEQNAMMGSQPIPLEQIPQSREQVEIENEIEKPLDEETAEELAIQGIASENKFNTIQWIAAKNIFINGISVVKIWTDKVEGIKIKYVPCKNFIHQETEDPFFSDCRYYGEVESITIAELKKIASRNNVVITNEELKKICLTTDSINDQTVVKVLNFSFKTFRKDVYKTKKKRENNRVSVINRTRDEGTDKAYIPRHESDISTRLEDIYDVWYKGTMIIGGEYKVIEYSLCENQAEYKGISIPPYLAFAPRISKNGYNSLVEKAIPKINLYQELDFRVQHFRNQLRGKIVSINPDTIAKIPDGNGGFYTPEDVLSFFFSLGIRFELSTDDDGDQIQTKTALNEIPSTPNHDLNSLVGELMRTENDILKIFGYVGSDNSRADPKDQWDSEPYRLSDNLALKDFSDALFMWSINCYQTMSSMLDNIFLFSDLKEKYVSMIGTDDVDVLETYRKNRAKHYFENFVEFRPSREQRMQLVANINNYVTQNLIDPLDAEELLNTKSKKLTLRLLRLRVEARKKESQNFELQKNQEMQNGNVVAAQAAAKAKQETIAVEYNFKEQYAQSDHMRKLEILEKEMNLSYLKDQNDKNFKSTMKQFEHENLERRDMLKKDRDEDTRLTAIDKSAKNQEQLIKLRNGEIDSINQLTKPEIDLSKL